MELRDEDMNAEPQVANTKSVRGKNQLEQPSTQGPSKARMLNRKTICPLLGWRGV